VNLRVVATAVLASYASVTVRTGIGGGAGSGIVPLFLQEKLAAGSNIKRRYKKFLRISWTEVD
jgi:hypothetical protein